MCGQVYFNYMKGLIAQLWLIKCIKAPTFTLDLVFEILKLIATQFNLIKITI